MAQNNPHGTSSIVSAANRGGQPLGNLGRQPSPFAQNQNPDPSFESNPAMEAFSPGNLLQEKRPPAEQLFQGIGQRPQPQRQAPAAMTPARIPPPVPQPPPQPDPWILARAFAPTTADIAQEL